MGPGTRAPAAQLQGVAAAGLAVAGAAVGQAEAEVRAELGRRGSGVAHRALALVLVVVPAPGAALAVPGPSRVVVARRDPVGARAAGATAAVMDRGARSPGV